MLSSWQAKTKQKAGFICISECYVIPGTFIYPMCVCVCRTVAYYITKKNVSELKVCGWYAAYFKAAKIFMWFVLGACSIFALHTTIHSTRAWIRLIVAWIIGSEFPQEKIMWLFLKRNWSYKLRIWRNKIDKINNMSKLSLDKKNRMFLMQKSSRRTRPK